MASQLTAALRETLELFDGAGVPKTTTEVADNLDLGRRSTYERLDRLVDHGCLETKKVGGNGRVWWRPADATTPAAGELADGTRSDQPRRENYEQFEQLVEAVEEYAIFMLDAGGHVQTWNPGAERIKGYETDEILGEHISTFYTADDCDDDVPEQNLSEAATRGAVEDEGWRVRGDGSRFWANVTITAIRDDDGDLTGYAKVTRDMSNRHEYEEELRRQRDYTRQLLETAPVGVLTVDEDGTFTTANQQAIELLELERTSDGETTVGINAVYDEDGEFLPPDERPYVRAFETGEPVRNWHAQIELSNGGRRWLSANIEPMVDERGDVERVLVTIEDVSQLKEQARRLQRQRDDLEAELESVFERVEDGFFALDAEFRFTYVNNYVSDLLNRPSAELVEEYIWDAFEPTPNAEAAFEEAIETQHSTSFEEFYEPFESWFEVHVYPSEDGLSVYFRDISERKERENELERYETTVETVWDGVTTLDADERFVMVNDAFCEMTGYTRDEILGEHATLVLNEDAHEAAGELHDQVEEGDLDIATLEYDLQTADGGSIPVEARFGPCEFEDGTVGGTGVIRDISERKERERELEESERRYRTLVESFPDGAVGLFDEELNYTAVGGQLVDQVGVDLDERIGYSVTDIYPDDLVEQVEPHFHAALAGETRSFEVDYHGLHLSAQTLPVKNADDEVFAGMLVVQDVTERKQRELELERQREQLAALNSINEVVRDIADAVIHQSTREEIEEIVCERLAAADSYEFAWVGDVDASSQTVNLRTEAGIEGYLDEITISVDPEDERSRGPTGRALRTGEMQTTRDTVLDSRHDPWRDHIQKYDFRSSAAIPLVHDETIYGVLNVYARRPNAFEGREQAVIAQLGEIIGHAIAAADRKRALMSDEVVELEFLIRDVFDVFDVDVSTAGAVTFDHAVPLEDEEFLIYGSATGDAVDSVEALVDAVPHWEEVTFRTDREGTAFQLRMSEPPVLSKAASLGGAVEHASIEDGDYQMTVHLAPGADVRQVIDTVQAAYPTAEMVKRHQLTRRDPSREEEIALTAGLTDRQRTALEVAVYSGYFEWPREASGEEVAESLGIAPPTFAQHIRKAQQKVFDSVFSTPAPS